MKSKILLSLLCLTTSGLFAQINFSDNFDTYTVGSPLGPQSPQWTTWSGTQGGADDINVTNTDAHSGTNSLYFSSTSATGGPADIVLPFQGPHNKGTFTFTSWFKIPSGKGGYFNFQGNATMGNLYTLNTFFNPNGTIDIQNSKEVVLSTSYTQAAWFEYKLVANLNTNDWELFINGTSKGKFQNADFDIASVDYYATGTTDAFWVDDVSFAYTPYTMPAKNGAVGYLNIANGLVTQTRIPSVTIRNLGTTAITSFTLNMNANGTNTPQNFSGLNIASGANYVAALTNNISLIAGLNTFTATVSNVNGAGPDGDAADDSKTITFTPTTPGADKLVVSEEATGTWCQWCPRGAVMLENMTKDFAGFFQGIAVHNGDPMVLSTYDGQLPGVTGYPSALTDRGIADDPSTIRNDFMQRIILTPVAKLKNGATYNSTNGDLEVSVSTTFKVAATGNYKIACVLVEDSVKGTTGYSQANAYAGGANGVMGGYETKPNPVPANLMKYDHVARAIAPSFGGVPNAFPASVSANSNYAHNFKFNISSWKKNKIHIIGLLLAPDGKIENASTSTIDEAVANGYVLGLFDKKITPSFVSVFPNPASETMNLQINATKFAQAEIKVVDLTGKIIMSSKQQIIDGTNIIPLSLKGMTNGNYLILVSMNNATQTVSFTKE